MTPLRLVIKGRIPSKKNSRCIFVRGGRICNIPSKAYATWHTSAMSQIPDSITKITEQLLSIDIKIWSPDKRESDLTNKAESIMDLLVDKGVIEDDNWWVVNKVTLSFMGVSKSDPRAEVDIHTGADNNV